MVELNNITIAGGTLSTGDLADHLNGLIEVEAAGGANTSALDGSVNTVTVAGYVKIEPTANLELKGTIDNTGTIEVDGGLQPSTTNALEIAGTVTLNGSGAVVLDGGSDAILAASAGATLDNANTISGGGAIGAGDNNLTLDNVSGTIDATNGTLTIETGANSITNGGTLEATGGATLAIDSNVANTGGTITAAVGSGIDLNNVTVTAGTVSSRGPFRMSAGRSSLRPAPARSTTLSSPTTAPSRPCRASFRIDPGTLTNAGTVEALAGAALTIEDVVTNTGGTILATGVGAVVALSGASITGGHLTAATGTLNFQGANTVSGVNVTNTGGSINNSGALQLNGTDTLTGDLNRPGGTITVGAGAVLNIWIAGDAAVWRHDQQSRDDRCGDRDGCDCRGDGNGRRIVGCGRGDAGLFSNTFSGSDIVNGGGTLSNTGALALGRTTR